MLYFEASVRFILTLLMWISHHEPERTEPLTWPEAQANIDDAANRGDRDAITMIITDPGYGFDPEWAVATVDCETGRRWDPWAVNPAGPYNGVWQVYRGTLGDVRQNTIEAASIMARQGRGAWPYCGR